MKIVDKYVAIARLTERCPSLSWEAGNRAFTAEVTLSEDLRHYIALLEDMALVTDLLVEGKRQNASSKSFNDAIGKIIAVTIALPTPNIEYAIVRSFDDLLKYDEFLLEPPKNYYDVENKTDVLPQGYKDAIKFVSLLGTASDHKEKNGSKLVCFLYSGAKLRVPVTFDVQNLRLLPKIDEFLESFIAPQHKEKINFFRAAVVKVGMGAPSEAQRFAHLLNNFTVIQNTFESDFNVYLADFSMEKVLGEIEEKTMKLADKVGASLADLQKTVITIPLAIIFAAPRIDQNGVQTWTNILILLSVWLFALFTWFFFASQKRNLKFIRNEIDEQKQYINDKHKLLAEKLLPKFKVLEKRCRDQDIYRRIIGSLMWVTTLTLTATFFFPSWFTP